MCVYGIKSTLLTLFVSLKSVSLFTVRLANSNKSYAKLSLYMQINSQINQTYLCLVNKVSVRIYLCIILDYFKE